MKDPILIDQWHIDFASVEKLTREEVSIISKAFINTEWLKEHIRQRLPTKLQEKLLISVTR